MSALYNSVCEQMILPLADFATQQQVMKLYKFYKEAQWWDRKRLVSYQNVA